MGNLRTNEVDQPDFDPDKEDNAADAASRIFSQLFGRVKTAEEEEILGVGDNPDAKDGDGDKDKDGDKPADKPEEKPDAAAKAADKAKEVIELATLPQEKQLEVERIRELQGLIVRFAAKLKFPSDQEKKQFLEQLQKELGEPIEGQPGKYHKLPEFGEKTKEGFRRIKEFFEKGHVPDLLGALDKQLLEIPPGFPLKIAGRQEPVLKSSEQLRQEIQQGKGFLDIDVTKLEDVRKISRVTDWVSAAEKSLHSNYVDRLEKYLNKKVEDGIKEGKFPAGWRRPEGMDKETWCSAVEQTMNAYTRMTRVMEAVDYLKKSGTGFKSDALENLPPGIKITRDESGKITNIDFGNNMVQDIQLQSDANRQKLDPLMAWCDKYEGKARQALAEAFKDRNHVPGFGEYEVHGGWVNPKTKDFVMGVKNQPGGDWQKFNLMSYDMDIKEERDAFGKVTKVFVSSDVAFQEVPPFGYLNTFAQDVHRTKAQQPVEYKPDDYVAVQTGPGAIEMVKAKDLADWKTRQQIKHYGEKAITLTMDAAMVVSGLGELRAAAKVAQLGAKEAVAIGGQVLKTEVAAQIPKGIAAGMVRKGLFEIGLGLTGVFHNAGAHEVPWMKAVSDLRTLYFLGHAGYSVSELARIPQAGRALGEALNPGLVKTADGMITSIRGTEEFMRASQLAKAGALEKLPFWKGLDPITHGAFNVSEKAFVGMFMWQAVGMSQRFADPYRPKALEAARRGLGEANLSDASALEKVIAAGNKPSEKTENYMRRFMDTMPGLQGQSKKEAEDIIAKVKELSKPGTKEEDKQKYIQELMKYFRYDGQGIHAIQDRKFKDGQLSEAQLTERAQGDKDKFDANVRKMAAMAILTLGRKPDGSWPENLSSRKVTVPEFTELTQVDDQIVESKKGPLEIEQKLTAEELVKLLQADLRETTDGKTRTEKAAALHENGLVSGEQLGDLLLSRIEGKQGVSKEERTRAIADLAGLISRLKVEEKLREAQFNRSESFAAKGLTAGLNSADLIKRLEKAAVDSDDKDVKATALLSLTLLKKENLDNTDRDRIREFFLKEPPGIKDDDLKKLLERDASSKPTDKEGWERKLIAAEMLMRMSMVPDARKIDKKTVGYLQECLAAKDQPEIAARAMEAIMKEDRLGGSPLAALEQLEPNENWRRKLVIAAINNLDIPAGQQAPGKQLEAAKARLKFIDAGTELLKGSEDRLIKGQLTAKLLARADMQTEPVEEVRAAAVKAIGDLGIKARMQVDILKKAVDAKTETSPTVRLAAIDAIEKLVSRNKERREILAPLAVAEPDPAVRERMARYYDPTGSIRDRNSQRARQEVNDAVVEQNKLEFKPSDIDKMVQDRFKKLAGSKSIFDYINAATEPHETWGFMQDRFQTLARVWDSSIDTINGWSAEYIKDIARTNLFYFELIAQNRAVKAFNKGVDDLSTAAMSGSKDKNVQVGDKTVSERDAAVLALGSLVRNGSRMGPAFYQHRDTNDRHTSTPGLRAFTAKERRERDDYARRSKDNLTVYDSDPWPATEVKIAEKMRDLCSQSSDNVNLSLLKEEMLRALKSDAKTSDASRRVLVDGLDRLLSNPGTAPEAKRDILKAVGEMVKTSREVQKDKLESTVAMIALLDKHGKASFETYSDAYSAMRTAVVARGENDQMPPQLRLRAQEMFDRNWVSVLAEADRIPAQQGNARTLNDLLPKNFEGLEKEKEGKTTGYDEDVHDAVQRIIMATKGLPLEADDVRRKTLEDLTDAKYDDRVRMAALHALFQSKEDQPVAQQKLLDLALTAKDRAIRQDAANLLMRKGMQCSEGSLEGLRTGVVDKLAAAQGKRAEDFVGKSAEETVREANDFIEKNINSKDAQVAAKARELQESLHRYGEGLALIANLKTGDKQTAGEAERLYKTAFNAFGVKEDDFKKLQAAVKGNGNEHSPNSKDVQDLCQRLLGNLQHTGAVPAVLSAFNGYARLSASKAVVDGKVNVENLQQAIGLASVSDTLGRIYYPEGSQGRIDQLKSLSDVYMQLGQQPINVRERWLRTAFGMIDQREKELDAYKKIADVQLKSTKDSLVKSIDDQKQTVLNDRLQQRFDVFSMTSSRPDFKTSTYLQNRMKEMSAEMEKDLAAIKDKDSTTYKHQRFVKDWLDLAITPEDKKPAALAKAEASLQDAMKATAEKFGPASPQYEQLVRKLWQFHKQQNQPEKAEAFFKAGLEANKGDDKAAVRAMLERQYNAFQERPKLRSVEEATKKIADLEGKAGKEAELGDAYKQLAQLHWPKDKAASEQAINKALEIYKKTPPSDKQYLDAIDQKKIILLDARTRVAELVDVCEIQKQILEKGLRPGETTPKLTSITTQLRDALTHRVHRDVAAFKYDDVEKDLTRLIQLDRQLNDGKLSKPVEDWLTRTMTTLRSQAFKHITDKDYDKALRPQQLALKFQREMNGGSLSANDFGLLNGLLVDLNKRTNDHLETAYKNKDNPDKAELAKAESALALLAALRGERLQDLEKQVKAKPDDAELADNLEKSKAGFINTHYTRIKAAMDQGKVDDAFALMKSAMPEAIKADSSFTIPLNLLGACEELMTKAGKQDKIPELRDHFLKSSVDTALDGETASRFGDTAGRMVRFLLEKEKPADAIKVMEKSVALAKTKAEELEKAGKTEAAAKLLDGIASLAKETAEREGLDPAAKTSLEQTRAQLAEKSFEMKKKLIVEQQKNPAIDSSNTLFEMVEYLKEKGKESDARELVKAHIDACCKAGNHANASRALSSNLDIFKSITPAGDIKKTLEPLFNAIKDGAQRDFTAGGDKKDAALRTLLDTESMLSSLSKDEAVPEGDRTAFSDKAKPIAAILERELLGNLDQLLKAPTVDANKIGEVLGQLMPVLNNQKREAEAKKLVDKYVDGIIAAAKTNTNGNACSSFRSAAQVVEELGKRLSGDKSDYMKTRADKFAAEADAKSTAGNHEAAADAYDAAVAAMSYHSYGGGDGADAIQRRLEELRAKATAAREKVPAR